MTEDILQHHIKYGWKCSAMQSFLGRHWMATVDGKVKCKHLHRTPAAARKCAQKWVSRWERLRK